MTPSRHCRRTAVLLSLAVPAALVAFAPGADATSPRGGPSCHGHRATIVGHRSQVHLTGTAHADVIVTNGAINVYARGGNDLVCVVNGHAAVTDGAGNDIVYGGDGADTSSVYLGSGNNVFIGGSAADQVYVAGHGHDDVRTGPGNDIVRVNSAPSRVEVDLGRGNDEAELHGVAGVRTVHGGAGSNRLIVDDLHGLTGPVWEVDNRRGRVSVDDRLAARISAFGDFVLDLASADSIRFRGGDAAERVRVVEGGGDPATAPPLGIDLDLGGGDDRGLVESFAAGRVVSAHELGGPGDDTLSGTLGDDVLDGGPGHDSVDGLAGTDACAAEKELNCESTLP